MTAGRGWIFQGALALSCWWPAGAVCHSVAAIPGAIYNPNELISGVVADPSSGVLVTKSPLTRALRCRGGRSAEVVPPPLRTLSAQDNVSLKPDLISNTNKGHGAGHGSHGVGHGSHDAVHDTHGAAHIPPPGNMKVITAVVNMVADLCPHGMLPVAYGMAAHGGTGTALAPSVVAFFGLISAYTLVSVGRACEQTGQYSFSGLWGDLIGKGSAWVIEFAISLMCFGCCIFYSAFIGDLFSSLAAGCGPLPPFLKKRWVDLVGLSAFPLLPLCLMRNLSALQYTSYGGLLAIAYTVFFVIKRALDGSYAEGGRFFEGIGEQYRSSGPNPLSSLGLFRRGRGLLTLCNMACVAFMIHYNGVKYYEELKERTVRNSALSIGTAMAVSFGVFFLMMMFGYKTFGSNAQALLLNNYHRTLDPLADVARLASGCAILCGYPLMFSGLKTSFFNLCRELTLKSKRTERLAPLFLDSPLLQNAISVSLLASITWVACHKREADVAGVIGLIGGLVGSSANYIIPAMLNLKLFSRSGKKKGLMSEVTLNKLLVVFGFVFMVLGTYEALSGDSSHSHSD